MLLLQLFLIFFLFETLMNVGQCESYDNKTEEIIKEYLQRVDTPNNPSLSSGFISAGNNLLKPSSVWGCDKYSAGFYVVTKRAITFAKDLTIYLQSGKNHSEESSKISTPGASAKQLKLNVLHNGIEFYRDLALIVEVLWHDSMNAISILGKQLSNELEHQISRLQLTKAS